MLDPTKKPNFEALEFVDAREEVTRLFKQARALGAAAKSNFEEILKIREEYRQACADLAEKTANVEELMQAAVILSKKIKSNIAESEESCAKNRETLENVKTVAEENVRQHDKIQAAVEGAGKILIESRRNTFFLLTGGAVLLVLLVIFFAVFFNTVHSSVDEKIDGPVKTIADGQESAAKLLDALLRRVEQIDKRLEDAESGLRGMPDGSGMSPEINAIRAKTAGNQKEIQELKDGVAAALKQLRDEIDALKN